MINRTLHILAACLVLLFGALPAFAAQSAAEERQSAVARLITAEDGVAPTTGNISAGLKVEMTPGWKTYWRSPGEVGLPPEIDWTGSDNIADVALLYPAPERFTAFDIENFGYGGTVVFPLQITLNEPGAPVRLEATARLLVCAEICIPEDFTFSLDLPQTQTTLIDTASAEAIAAASARVPKALDQAGIATLTAFVDEARLVVSAERETPFGNPDIFPELADTAFGKPDIRLSDGGRALWASLPVLYLPEGAGAADITLTDGAWATTGTAEMLGSPPVAPLSTGLLWTAFIAVLGGLILNVMPCVLPVLSLKVGHALERAGQGAPRVRAGFLASAAGILAFMWALAAILFALKSMGSAVGWGVQFQSPVFLSLMILLMVLFAANMAGLFEINLPDALQRRMGGPTGAGLAGDFATGAFAAVMATPCSAPFLGTAVAFALAGGAVDVFVIFTALGIGLALPYLLFAARPQLITAMPRPGKWMVWVKWVLAGLLVLTAIWLLFVLVASAGLASALALAAIALAMALLLASRRSAALGALLFAAGLALPAYLASAPTPAANQDWAAFDMRVIEEEVAAGRVIFVDITADWCLTCKANKALVLDRAPVADWLSADGITPMQGDWTRPDPVIQSYLQSFGRFGIPFNAVYGPGAPQGIALPELLTKAAIEEALEAAR